MKHWQLKMDIIGELPTGWEFALFEDLLDYIQPTKYIVASTDYDDKYKTPVLTAGKSFIIGYTNEMNDIFNLLPTIIFDDFTTSTQFVNFPFKVKSSAMKILVPTCKHVNIKFAFYFMQTIHIHVDTHKRFWISHYSRLPIPLPPLPEQHRIVAKIEELFSSLDKGIENLKTAQAQLKTYRQAVLKWAFDGKNYTSFENLVESSQNGISKRNSTDGEDYKVLRLADISNCKISIKEPREIKLTVTEVAKYRLNEDDLLCIRVNGSKDLVGKMILVDKNDELNKWAFCDHLIRFVLKSDVAFSKYYYYFFKTVGVRKYIHDNMVTSAGQNTVSQVTIKNILVPILPLVEQNQIVSEIETRLSVCDKLEESITQSLIQAEALRQSILKKAFEGKLVPQDPLDEPASVLLERIRAEREKNEPQKKTRSKKVKQ